MDHKAVLEAVQAQEARLVLPRFNDDDAWQLGSWLRNVAAEREMPVMIGIRRFNRPLFWSALAGSSADNVDWVRRKSNVVERFDASSWLMHNKLALSGVSLEEKFGLPERDYAAHGGSFPIRTPEAGLIGSVTVSGLPQEQDHILVARALRELIGASDLDLPELA